MLTMNDLNNQINPEELDKIAKTNPLAKEKLKSAIKNQLRYTASFFNFVGEAKIDALTEKLVDDGYGFTQIKQALNKLIDDFDKFPSYKELRFVLSSFSQNKSIKVDYKEDEDIKKYRSLKNMWLSKYTQEQLSNYTEWYWRSIYKLDKEMMKSLSTDRWEISPLFDWHDNFYKLDKDKIKDVAERKNKILENNRKKPYRYRSSHIDPFNANKEWIKYKGCEK